MWSQMNQLPGDGVNIVGVNLPHIVFQPIEGQVQYKTADITPVFWFHYTPDILVVPEQSPIKSFADFIKAAEPEFQSWLASDKPFPTPDLAALFHFD